MRTARSSRLKLSVTAVRASTFRAAIAPLPFLPPFKLLRSLERGFAGAVL